MNELESIAAAAEALRRKGEPFVVATVVRVRGSSYRRPGARMLLTRDRWVAGSVSGGCLEQDLVKKGWWRTRHGEPALVTYDARFPEDFESGAGVAEGLGCDGAVDVLLEPQREAGLDAVAFVARCFRAQRCGALATIFRGDGALVGAHVALASDGTVEADPMDGGTRRWLAAACRDVLAREETSVVSFASPGGPLEALIEAVLPPPRLFVFGAGHDAVPVVAIAETVGWEAFVCEPHARFATRERFGGARAILVGGPTELARRVDDSHRAMAVVMAHDYERDRACLAALLGTNVRYLGMLGPRRRTVRMLAELGMKQEDPRLHAPVGLALGAETPQEIALSIVAEAQSVLKGASAVSLREHAGAIHATPCSSRAAE